MSNIVKFFLVLILLSGLVLLNTGCGDKPKEPQTSKVVSKKIDVKKTAKKPPKKKATKKAKAKPASKTPPKKIGCPNQYRQSRFK